MKKQDNTVRHNPEAGTYGDCHRACFAMMLNMDIEDIPHFYDMSDGRTAEDAFQMQVDFLAGLGLAQGSIIFDGSNALEDCLLSVGAHIKNIPLILGGMSIKGCGHSVVVLNGAIWHDPTGSGIVGPLDGYFWFTFFSRPAL